MLWITEREMLDGLDDREYWDEFCGIVKSKVEGRTVDRNKRATVIV